MRAASTRRKKTTGVLLASLPSLRSLAGSPVSGEAIR
jgi:hypothetical protein